MTEDDRMELKILLRDIERRELVSTYGNEDSVDTWLISHTLKTLIRILLEKEDYHKE